MDSLLTSLLSLENQCEGGRIRISEKQFATRANPASQWSINDKLSFYMPPVGDNYTGDNWLVDSDAFMKAAMSMNT